MKQILFFALREDLLALLQFIDSQSPLKYVRMGNFLRDEIKDGISVFDQGAGIPNLGKASADSSAACEAFLVCERDTLINLRGLQLDNEERVCVDQLANPDSVEFKPGGIWNEDIVLHGRIATASESQVSQALMKRFQTAARKTFSKVKAFYVGPKAVVLLESGKRLSISAQSPREFDLTLANLKC
jgi:hypothetical protein